VLEGIDNVALSIYCNNQTQYIRHFVVYFVFPEDKSLVYTTVPVSDRRCVKTVKIYINYNIKILRLIMKQKKVDDKNTITISADVITSADLKNLDTIRRQRLSTVKETYE